MLKLLRAGAVVLALLSFWTGPALAESGACDFAEWGHRYIKVHKEGAALTYRITVAGPTWRTIPYGWHANGLLICNACDELDSTNGLFHLFADPGKKDPPYSRNSTDRLAAGQESFGYPIATVVADHLLPVATRDDVKIGPLSGYAVLYRIAEEWVRWRFPNDNSPNEMGLLVVSLTDTCVVFETAISTKLKAHAPDWFLLDSLVQETSIERGSLLDWLMPLQEGITVRPK